MSVTVFGIRHHGPGSARSLVRSLQALRPDIVLVEGPPDADTAIPFATHPEMTPPVALLVYAPDQLQQAAFYPFAQFSPEWQALRYGLEQGVPVRFIDLPQTHRLALKAKDEELGTQEREEEEAIAAEEDPEKGQDDGEPLRRSLPADPLRWLATAAGYSDSERWWEHLVEQRQDSTALFEAILEAMTALREDLETTHPPDLENAFDRLEAQREAYMRRMIRQAEKEGFAAIAVVCGAWHAPALSEPLPAQKHDAALLKGLPKLKVKATWIPWTYGRLANTSGYGAGIPSPGWYEHLWRSSDSNQSGSETAIRWMTRVARLLREEDLDASSASVIEAVRLAETLSALRDSTAPSLMEFNEAAQTIFCFGDATPMQLIHQKLIISDRLGQVPPETPLVPLQQDLQQLQKRLRLKPEANEKQLTLDLRKPLDLERSHLLHRLALLTIPWGTPQSTSGKGTFKEAWELRWYPELSLSVIEAGHWGNTILSAATASVRAQASAATTLATLTGLLDQVLLAALTEVVTPLIQQLQAIAAVASDVAHLMAALPALANVVRYRDVRQTDSAAVAQVVDGLVTRICIGLPGACASLDDDAATLMLEAINQTHSAIRLLQQESHLQSWSATLQSLADRTSMHGLIAGRSCRLLLDAGTFSPTEAARRLGLALSLATEPTQAAAWVEGFLQGSGLLLIHDGAIWDVLDNWVTQLSAETFTALLPLLRRTFANFTAPERRQMGERVRLGQQGQAPENRDFDRDRADNALPLIAQLLGLSTPTVTR
ncbi:DUF5682 family protein [Vacuolonema iberomarrocanum]|uniref:DUF5682 family protein n=1 Tax=Vacuolonema iberomarrocanum TaxID=3454632 RepID=UPI0019E8AC4D|nr:hypothetical protein [filamentous cyanobacterium LEGE 07170]